MYKILESSVKYIHTDREICPCYASTSSHLPSMVLGDPEVTANLCCHFAYLYWEGCVICSIIFGNFWVTKYVADL